MIFFFFFQAEDGIRDYKVTGVQTCALPICARSARVEWAVRVPAPSQLRRCLRGDRRNGDGGRRADCRRDLIDRVCCAREKTDCGGREGPWTRIDVKQPHPAFDLHFGRRWQPGSEIYLPHFDDNRSRTPPPWHRETRGAAPHRMCPPRRPCR